MAEIKICVLRSSSKGNATVVFSKKTKILVDCGVSGKIVEECLERIGINPCELDAILVTHEHSDHIKGVGVISRKFGIPVFANEGTWSGMERHLGRMSEENVRVIDSRGSFFINDIKVTPFKIPHDAGQPVGYSFENQEDKVAVATDIGVMTEEIFEAIKGSRAVLLESNYDLNMLEIGTYPYELKCRIKSELGHLCNDDAALTVKDLIETGTKKIVLGHISQENNYPRLVFQTAKLCLESRGFKENKDFELYVMEPDCMGEVL